MAVIVASRWGGTVESAATARAIELSKDADDLGALTSLARVVLTAGLPEAIGPVLERLQDSAAVTTSANELLDALPPLGWIVRYGDVRGTETEHVKQVLDTILIRGCISLPAACVSLDDDAATDMAGRLDSTQSVVSLLEDEDHRAMWRDALVQISNLVGSHGLVLGRAARLLFDSGDMPPEEVAKRLSQAASPGAKPAETAGWIEGLLGRSAQLLLHEERLWAILDAWVGELDPDQFVETLPLLRRTFSVFPGPERRQLGEKAKGETSAVIEAEDLDAERAARPLPLLRLILGLEKSP